MTGAYHNTYADVRNADEIKTNCWREGVQVGIQIHVAPL